MNVNKYEQLQRKNEAFHMKYFASQLFYIYTFIRTNCSHKTIKATHKIN